MLKKSFYEDVDTQQSNPKEPFYHYLCFTYAEKFRFSAEFIEMRRQALDTFINRIASHCELQQSEDLRIFLQADEEVILLSSKCCSSAAAVDV